LIKLFVKFVFEFFQLLETQYYFQDYFAYITSDYPLIIRYLRKTTLRWWTNTCLLLFVLSHIGEAFASYVSS